MPIDPDFDRFMPVLDTDARTTKRPSNPDRDDAQIFNQDTDRRIPKRLFNHDRVDAQTFPQDSPPHQPVVILPLGRRSRREQKHKTLSGGVAQPDSSGRDVPPSPITSMHMDDRESKGEKRLKMIRQPETRPISQDELISEVKGIYAGLIMVEVKYYEVNTKQHQAALEIVRRRSPLNNEQWYATRALTSMILLLILSRQVLIALHRTLLHEHHDFFLASQHPSSSSATVKRTHSPPGPRAFTMINKNLKDGGPLFDRSCDRPRSLPIIALGRCKSQLKNPGFAVPTGRSPPQRDQSPYLGELLQDPPPPLGYSNIFAGSIQTGPPVPLKAPETSRGSSLEYSPGQLSDALGSTPANESQGSSAEADPNDQELSKLGPETLSSFLTQDFDEKIKCDREALALKYPNQAYKILSVQYNHPRQITRESTKADFREI